MRFLTPKKKLTYKSKRRQVISFSSQRNFNHFFEAEKNTFDFIKPLAIIFFTINTGIMAVLFEYVDKYGYIIFTLALGIFISMIFVIISVHLIRKSILYININNNKFLIARKKISFNDSI